MIRRYGYSERRLLLGSLAMLLGGVALALVTRGFADHADLAGALVGTALALRGGYRLARLWTDRRWPVRVTGTVVRLEPWRSHRRGRGLPPEPWLFRLTVKGAVVPAPGRSGGRTGTGSGRPSR